MADERLEERVGRRLREARIGARLTVREAAIAAGLPDHSILVRYENGAARPPMDRLAALAGAYHTTLAAILAERDETVSLIEAVERANRATLERLRAVLDANSPF
jgi:transcriptional regulator with XRE-family HTH domain